MNTITYELLEARLIADRGMLFPSPLTCLYPTIIVPTQAIHLQTANQRYTLCKGQFIVLLHEMDVIHIKPSEDNEFSPIYGISFKSYQLTKRDNDSMLYHISLEHLPKHGEIMQFPRQAEGMLHHLVDQFHQTPTVPASPRLHLLLHELLDTILIVSPYDSSFFTNDKAIQQAVTYINQHYKLPLTRSFLAQMTGFNESYFSSLFRKETGWSFAEYLNRIRIEKAKHIMLTTTDKMHEIASKTGFSDGSYLGKTFNKIVHVSPGNFRSRQNTTRVAGIQFIGALLAVGIQPIATMHEVLRASLMLQDQIPDIVELEDINMIEALKALEPELILAPTYYYNYPNVMKTLEQIAPVITMAWGKMDKIEEVRTVGRLFGRTYEAEQWVSRLQQQAHEARQLIARSLVPNSTVGLYELWYDGLWMIPHLHVRSAFNLYHLLELTPPRRIQEEVLDPNIHRNKIHEQELLSYAADHMFLIVSTDDTEAFLTKLMQRSVWQELVHEQGCRIHLLKQNEFWLDDGMLLERQLNTLVQLLTSNS
ncbi:HTH-type transcriptional activator Btr [compost metagenome]